MNKKDFSIAILVGQTPKEAFTAIANVRGWWSENIEGGTAKLGDEFTYRYEDVHYCKLNLVEVVPNKKMVWRVVDNYFAFTKDKTEWKGTNVVFEISKNGDNTELRFTHVGLVPEYECFDACSKAWGSYIDGSLRNLTTKGKGQPNPMEDTVGKRAAR